MTMFNALATAATASIMNRAFSISSSGSKEPREKQRYSRGNDHVDYCRRQQDLPTESHQLIVSEARQREPDPQEKKHDQQHLNHEIDQAQPWISGDAGAHPTS